MFVFAYGVLAYVIFLLTSVYAVGFVENWIASQTLDGVPGGDSGGLAAVFTNTALFGLFALQHVLMGHPLFKQAWNRVLPAGAERSTRVLVSSLFLMALFLRWRPIQLEVWSLGFHPLGFALELLSFAGWALAFIATLQIDHLELFGLRQALAHAQGVDPTETSFQVPFLYRWVRHPIYLGLLVALWCAPRMTFGHLLFAGLTTAYVVLLARMEEHELELEHPEYRGYQAHVPMLWPRSTPVPFRKRAG
jgi:protein-S-isoprenylcysteine O-methyltransferase Ste14